MNPTEEQKQFEEGLANYEMQESKDGEPKELTDLSWVARRIRLILNEVEKVVQFEKAETEKIQAFSLSQLNKMKDRIDQLNVLARNVMVADGGYGRDKGQAKFYDLPGIGRFSFGSTRESVDDSFYKDMEPEGQTLLQKKYSQYFTETISVRPEKSQILLALKAFPDAEVPGFKLRSKIETFKFKAE